MPRETRAGCQRRFGIIGIQYHLFTARSHREELKQSFEANRKIFLQLRDEEERFGLVSISESDEADDLRKQAEEAKRKAQCTRKEIDAMLGKWVLEPEKEKPVRERSVCH